MRSLRRLGHAHAAQGFVEAGLHALEADDVVGAGGPVHGHERTAGRRAAARRPGCVAARTKPLEVRRRELRPPGARAVAAGAAGAGMRAGLAVAGVLGQDEVVRVCARRRRRARSFALLGRDEAGSRSCASVWCFWRSTMRPRSSRTRSLDEHLAAESVAQERAERGRAGVRRLEQEQPDLAAEDGHRCSTLRAACGPPDAR